MLARATSEIATRKGVTPTPIPSNLYQKPLDTYLSSPYMSEGRRSLTHRTTPQLPRITALYGLNAQDSFVRFPGAYYKPFTQEQSTSDEILINPSFSVWFAGRTHVMVKRQIEERFWKYLKTGVRNKPRSQAPDVTFDGSRVSCCAKFQFLSDGIPRRAFAELQGEGIWFSSDVESNMGQENIFGPRDSTPLPTYYQILRRVQVNRSSTVPHRLSLLTTHGFVNYYNTHELDFAKRGAFFLQYNWKHFVAQSLLMQPMDSDKPLIHEFCREPNIVNAQRALQTAQSPSTVKILRNYVTSEGDFVKTIKDMGKTPVKWALTVFLYKVWNMIASKRIQRIGARVVVGDMVVDRRKFKNTEDDTEFPRYMVKHVRTEEECFEYSMYDVVLPLPYNHEPLQTHHFPMLEKFNFVACKTHYESLMLQLNCNHFWYHLNQNAEMKGLLGGVFPFKYRTIFSRPLSLRHRVLLDPYSLHNVYDEHGSSARHFQHDVACGHLGIDPSTVNLLDSLGNDDDFIPNTSMDHQEKPIPTKPHGDPFIYCEKTVGIETVLPRGAHIESCLREVFALSAPSTQDDITLRKAVAYHLFNQKTSDDTHADAASHAAARDGGEEKTEEVATEQSVLRCETCGSTNDPTRSVCLVCGDPLNKAGN